MEPLESQRLRTLWSNRDCRLLDPGEPVLQLELCSQDMVLTSLTLDGLQAALNELQDERWSGLVLSSAGPHFGLGASLPTLWENFEKGQWDLLEARGKRFQSLHLALAQHRKPVVAAVAGYALGAGCELAMHCHSVVAQADARLGLVESRAGILPAAGGSKEMALRAGSARQLGQALICLSRGQLASDAEQAFELGYLRPEWDRVGTLEDARQRVHELCQLTRPQVPSGFRLVCGHPELLEFLAQEAQSWSRFDRSLGESAAHLLTGGKAKGEWVEVQELLDLERALLRELGSNGRSRARMRYLLQAGLIQQLQNP